MSTVEPTEVGGLPTGWKVAEIRDFARVVRGSSPRPAGDPKFFNGSFIPWLTVAAITNAHESEMRIDETETSLTEEGAKRSRELAPETIIIANSGATLGVAKVLGIRSCANDGVAALFDVRGADKEFVCHFINTRTAYLRDVVAPGNGQPNLNTTLIGNIQVPLPPISEQREIARCLSDVDSLILALERSILKKRDLKQAAMQQLLTGRRRLTGFPGQWSLKRVGDIADCTAGGTPNTSTPKYWGGQIRWMNSGELNLKRVGEVEGRITAEGLKNSSAKILPARCVLIGLAGQGKTRGTVALNLVPLCTNQSIAAILPNPGFVPEYLYYNLDLRYDELRGMSTGDGGRGGLNLTIVRSIAVPFPELAEQRAIAEVLAEMDTEIALLQAHCDKMQTVKQAMMQPLLTGRIRLI